MSPTHDAPRRVRAFMKRVLCAAILSSCMNKPALLTLHLRTPCCETCQSLPLFAGLSFCQEVFEGVPKLLLSGEGQKDTRAAWHHREADYDFDETRISESHFLLHLLLQIRGIQSSVMASSTHGLSVASESARSCRGDAWGCHTMLETNKALAQVTCRLSRCALELGARATDAAAMLCTVSWLRPWCRRSLRLDELFKGFVWHRALSASL